MSAEAPQLPSGLSVADLIANLPCNWVRFSKAKRGPKVAYFCRFCSSFAKRQVCPMEHRP